jgi:imidazolonepropionase-like amidohydrolase
MQFIQWCTLRKFSETLLMRKILLAAGLLLLAAISYAQERRIVLQGVNIVDVEKGAILKNQDVLITGDRISRIARAGAVRPQGGDSIVNCAGQYLIPGLWDMHTHVWFADYYFPLFIANGVTGHRGMLETIAVASQWRTQGKMPGTMIPAGFYAGPILDGPKPQWPGSVALSNPEQGRRAVDSLKNKLHVDFVKVYSGLSRETYYAIVEEAKKQQISFAGHVPASMNLLECVRAGQRTTEHMMGMIETASDSSDYYYGVVHGTIKDSLIRNNRMARRAMLARTFSEKRLQMVIEELKKYDSWVCPTMTVLRGIAYIKDSAMMNDPRMQYALPMFKNMWNPAGDARFRNSPNDFFENEKKEFEMQKRILNLLHKGGVKILAGTDTPNPYCFPGFSLHDELQIMVESGLTPVQALQTATLNPAIFFNILNDYGSVSEKKIASLVLLKANPLENISNTKNISAVILRGKFIDSNGINELLAKIRKMAGN